MQDLNTALHDVKEEINHPRGLPTHLMELADEFKQILTQLIADLKFLLNWKKYQAEVGGASKHPDAWFNL